jgi:hypothetical protein
LTDVGLGLRFRQNLRADDVDDRRPRDPAKNRSRRDDYDAACSDDRVCAERGGQAGDCDDRRGLGPAAAPLLTSPVKAMRL